MPKSRPTINPARREHMARLIRQKRIEAGMEQGELAARVGVTANAVCNWERCLSRPDLDTLPILCRELKVSAAELLDMKPEMTLSGNERNALESYRRLSPSRQRMIQSLMDQLELDERRERARQLRSAYLRRSTFGQSAAAGPGGPMEEYATPEDVYVRANPCAERSTLLVRVNGHSMEPVYADGSMVYVDERQEPREGDDVVVIYEGTMYIKQFTRKGLVSYNPDRRQFPVIKVNGWQEVRYVGKVIGRVNEYDLAEGKELAAVEAAYASGDD